MAISANPSAAKIEPRHLFIVFAPEANFSYRDAHGSFGRRISYRELNDLANRAAKGLQYLGSGLACMSGLSIPSQRVSVVVLPPDRALEAAGKRVSLR